MATINEPDVSSSKVSSSIDRNFSRFLLENHYSTKLPSIFKSKSANRLNFDGNSFDFQQMFSFRERKHFSTHQLAESSIQRLLNNEQFRRCQARLIEYRQLSIIPGISLKLNNEQKIVNGNSRNEPIVLPSRENKIEMTKVKQQIDETDFDDDESILSNQTDRRRRAKHWIQDHQFFFAES